MAGGKRSKKTTQQYNCPARVVGKTTTLAMRRDHFAALWGGRAWKAHALAKLRGKTVCLQCCQVNTDCFFEANTCAGWSQWCNSHGWGYIWATKTKHIVATGDEAKTRAINALRKRLLIGKQN